MSDYGLYQAYGGLLLSALLPIYLGSHSCLKMPKTLKDKFNLNDDINAEEEEEEDDESESITVQDALLFPVLGSFTLGGLYLAFKYLDKDTINMVFSYYFSLMSVGALARTQVAAVRAISSIKRWNTLTKWKLSLEKNSKLYSYFSFNYIHISTFILSIILTLINHFKSHWILSNIIALCFSYNAICLVRLDSFLTGSALLGGLFFYDIYWVFATEVMVSVAKAFDAPVKIVWPKEFGASSGFSLLGLGDIVVPGVFIALSLRFDYYLALKQSPPPTPSSKFSKPYFYSCFSAYIIGLVTCIIVMHTFKAAQPALLYLSPLCTFSVILCAFIRGEITEFWKFDDGAEEQKKVLEKKDEQKKIEEEKEKNGNKEVEDDKEQKNSGVSTAVEESEESVGRVLRTRIVK